MRADVVWMAAALSAVTVLFAACHSFPRDPWAGAELASARAAWERGDMSVLGDLADALFARDPSSEAGHFIAALRAHATGRHAEATTHFEALPPGSPAARRLAEPALWSYVKQGELASARAHAERAKLGRAAIARLDLAIEWPLRVVVEGVVELTFSDDTLSPYMPGLHARLNGRDILARLDTGGTFLHLSAEFAAELGIETVACETVFASLSRTRVCFGVADLELGGARLENVPVAVHRDGISSDALAAAFGARADAIIGTNVLEQFLVTVDGPGRRILLSDRRNATSQREQLAQLGGRGIEVPFLLWGEHFMIAPGRLPGVARAQLFVDSGLVVVTEERGQADFLLARSLLATAGVSNNGPLVDLPGSAGLAGALQSDLVAHPASDRAWQGFGDWGGIGVDGLVGWGYLGRYTWTIDFDRMVYRLVEP